MLSQSECPLQSHWFQPTNQVPVIPPLLLKLAIRLLLYRQFWLMVCFCKVYRDGASSGTLCLQHKMFFLKAFLHQMRCTWQSSLSYNQIYMTKICTQTSCLYLSPSVSRCRTSLTHTHTHTHTHTNQPCAFLPAVQRNTESFGLAADYALFSPSQIQ